MQSTNEELETSKEEMQSINEELATVNAELQQKVIDLSRANNDMNNLLAGTGVGTVFVDTQLRIQRFTPAVTQVINLILTDVGRPLRHIVSNLVGYDRLVEDLREVLETLVPKEIEVQTKSGSWFSLRVRPYRTLENVIEGAVITSFDITELRRAREAQRETTALRRLAVVVRDASSAITVQDREGQILAWNPGAEKLYGFTEAEALTKNIREMIPDHLFEDALATARRLARSEVLQPYRTQRVAKDGRTVTVWVTASALVNSDGEAYAIATTEREVGAEERTESGRGGEERGHATEPS
jgi:two-component system CheB/CheR fusion protein